MYVTFHMFGGMLRDTIAFLKFIHTPFASFLFSVLLGVTQFMNRH